MSKFPRLPQDDSSSFDLPNRVSGFLDSYSGRYSNPFDIPNSQYSQPGSFISPFTDLESAQLHIERLSMKIEDLYSSLSSVRNFKKNRSRTEKSTSLVVVDANKPLIYSIECRLSELYQFKDDLEKFIKKVESNFLFSGFVSFGKLNLELRVRQRDSPFINKDQIFQEFKKFNQSLEVKAQKEDKKKEFFWEFFKEIEESTRQRYEEMTFDLTFIRKKEGKEDKKIRFVADMEGKLFNKYKVEEDAKLKELDWQIMMANIKKSYYQDQLKQLTSREQDLTRISRNITEKTLESVKQKAQLEEDLEDFEVLKYNQKVMFNEKVECINTTLQFIEDCKIDLPQNSKINETYKESVRSPEKIEDEIAQLERQLKDLEHEYRTSRHQQSIESYQMNANRVKNNIMNLKSLLAMQKTERTSSALRNQISKLDKQIDTVPESPKMKNSFISSSSDTSLKGIKKLPHHPLPSAIRVSPLKKLEITTPKLNMSDFKNTPSRRSPGIPESPKLETPMSRQLRVKEQLLLEREEELEKDEKKLQELWRRVPQGEEMIPVLQKEIFEYRKKKMELFKHQDQLEREKQEWRDHMKKLEEKETKIKIKQNKLLEDKTKFEQKRQPLIEKLDWLCLRLSEGLE